MTNEISSERRVEVSIAKIAAMMREIKRGGGRIVFVDGPGGRAHRRRRVFQRDRPQGLRDVLLPGNALAVHDVEHALFGTSLGVDLEAGAPVKGGHRHHMRAINTVNRAGGIRAAVESGVLKLGHHVRAA